MFSVRDERYKLVARPAGKSFELYDLAADPGERVDVAAQHPDEVEALRSAFRAWRATLRPLATTSTQLDAETEQGLRSLGYIH
jgi:arylsulfatase A-like enzyme